MSWFEVFEAIFNYQFMLRAIIVGVMVAISSSVIGSFLVLKKFSMIGHGLSHVAFAGVAIGLWLNQTPILVTVPIVVVVSIFILKLNQSVQLHGDAAIGLSAAFAMALGTILASVGGGFNVDLFSYLFGSILAIGQIDLYLSIIFSTIVLITVTVFYHDLFAMTYEEEFAKVSGVKTSHLNTLLAVLTGLAVVIGIRVIGTVLISSLIIFPTVIAMQFNKGFRGTIFLAVFSSIFTVILGLLVSFKYDLPSGSTIVIVNGLVFFTIYLYNTIRKLTQN